MAPRLLLIRVQVVEVTASEEEEPRHPGGVSSEMDML